MTKEFNNLQEIEKYYDEKINAYVFKEDDKYIDLVIFNFDLKINSNIDACGIDAYNIKANHIKASNINACNIDVYNIDAWDIKANDISADNINADNINAWNISYYAVCFAYNNITCKSIKGRRKNARHFVLDGVLEVEDK